MTRITVGYPGTGRREAVTADTLDDTLLLIFAAVLGHDMHAPGRRMQLELVEDTTPLSQNEGPR